MKRMFWINFANTVVGGVVMLLAGQTFNKDFFAGTER
jgi:hypothetical protein